ncbi:MAG: class I SAM-dependent methyltransferase [Actinomycetota bacterium]
MSIYDVIARCRSCGSTDLETVLDLGTTPLADSLLTTEQLDEQEPMVPLTLVVCRECALAQILETVEPEVLFHDQYPYFSSVSPRLREHFGSSARDIIASEELGADDLVVEAASNDGCMLKNFVEAGVPVLGIDPAGAPVRAAIEAGVPTLHDFFGHELAKTVRAEHGEASVFLGNNVLAHVADLNGFVAGMAELLADDGLAVIECPYVLDLVDHVEFDTIYHQHLCYFSITALVSLFERHGLRLVDVARIDIHGGSVRLFIRRGGEVSDRVSDLLVDERRRGFDSPEGYRRFADRVRGLRTDLRQLLDDLHADGKRVVGYAAAAKATTMLSFCGLGTDHLEYVCDLNEFKQGKYMPGSRLPIVAPSRLAEDRPDHVVILAWNFADEIVRQNSDFEAAGGRFIVPVPDPRVLEPAAAGGGAS